VSQQVQIVLSYNVIVEVKQLLKDCHKIRAIKAVRNSGKIYDASEPKGFRSPGLKESKHACDTMSGFMDPTTASATIIPAWRVNSLKVVGPDNKEIEMDIETLQMNFLTHLSALGLVEVDRLLGLVQFIRAWQGDVEPETTSED
jgi:hypothetical protein